MKYKDKSKITEEEVELKKVVLKKAIKPKPVVKTVKVKLMAKESVVKMKLENGCINIPESHVDILERHGIIKRVK